MNNTLNYLSTSQRIRIEPRIFLVGSYIYPVGGIFHFGFIFVLPSWAYTHWPSSIYLAASHGLFSSGGIFVEGKHLVSSSPFLRCSSMRLPVSFCLVGVPDFNCIYSVPFVTYVSPWFSKQTKDGSRLCMH